MINFWRGSSGPGPSSLSLLFYASRKADPTNTSNDDGVENDVDDDDSADEDDNDNDENDDDDDNNDVYDYDDGNDYDADEQDEHGRRFENVAGYRFEKLEVTFMATDVSESCHLARNIEVIQVCWAEWWGELLKGLMAEWLACPSITPTTRVRILQFLQVHSGSRLPVNPAVHPSEVSKCVDDVSCRMLAGEMFQWFKCALSQTSQWLS
ncbi:hypothetical protein HELRODRAFT_163978 [Helobdella robusta]|uniref:Uncharacterized protein n=1 Tax=Helobdella robusta TaxID=6412 RepID=T1EUP8_HELRO|nr:hypothetical protein HELRODRAFT_163978 [Helobdella robusta]ESN94188.1 hypothetical protein HELRODRAFT_163978 [Helobdella robusta]